MIERSTDIKAALRSRQRGFLLNPFRFVGGGGSPEPADPYENDVSLLLHFDAASPPQTGGVTLDSSKRTKVVSLVGSTQLTAASALFGPSGLLMVSGGGVTCPANSDFALDGDFTFETGFYIDTNSNSLFGLFNIGTYASGMLVRIRLNMIELFINGVETSITTTVSPFVYHRLSLSRISGVVHVALDGIEVGALNNAGSIAAGQVRIGASAHNVGEVFVGYIDELRLTKGVGRYSGNYTPSSVPFPDPAPEPAPTSDPHWANVVSLLRFDGADNDTTTIDSSTLALPVVMGAGSTLKNSYAKFGTTGLKLSGGGNERAYITSPSAFSMPAKFTAEGWIRNETDSDGYYYVFQLARSTDSHTSYLSLRFADAGYGDQLQLSMDDTDRILGPTKSEVLGTYIHWAYSRDDDYIGRFFINGALQGYTSHPKDLSLCDTAVVGGTVNNAFRFIGGIDEWRITKGVCRYTADFTPPAAAFPNS